MLGYNLLKRIDWIELVRDTAIVTSACVFTVLYLLALSSFVWGPIVLALWYFRS